MSNENDMANFEPESPGGMRPSGSTSRPRPDLSAMYVAMLVTALFGLVVLFTVAAIVGEKEPATSARDTEAALEELSAGFPWLAVAGVVFLGLGTVLIVIYVALRAAGMRPVPQRPRNSVAWTLGALVKGLIIVMFVFVALSIAGPFLGAGAVLVMMYLIRHFTRVRAEAQESADVGAGVTGAFIVKLLMAFGLIVGLSFVQWLVLDSLSEIMMIIIVSAMIEILAVVWILLMLKVEYGAGISDAGIKFGEPLRDIGYAFLAYLAVTPVFTLTYQAWRWLGEWLGFEYKPQHALSWLLETESALTVAMLSASVVLLAPVVEEFFFRGFTYPALRRHFGVTPAILVSSLYFSLIHFDFFSILPIMILGVAMAFLYERRQSLVAPVALHFFHNARVIGMVLFLRYMSG